MKIERFSIYRPTLEMDSSFVTALRTVRELEPVLIKIETDDGYTGWGEAPVSPRVTGETPDSAEAALDVLLPRLLGSDPADREGVHEKMGETISGNTASRASVDIGIHDILGQAWGVPLWKVFGGFRSNKITTDFTISLGEPDEMARRADELVSKGFRSLKIKLGGEVDRDIRRLKEIEDRVADRASYRIDANQGWNRIETRQFTEEMEGLPIDFIEQPLLDSDLAGMKEVRTASPIPIMADESVHGPESAREVIRRGAADFLNIKLSKAGGFWPAQKVAAIAEASHVPCMVGGMSSTGILATAAAHLAAGRKVVKFRDLDMGTSIKENVIGVGGSYLEGNYRVLSEGAGLGIESVDEDLIGPPVEVYQL